jgi:hypothetical protein
MRVVSVVAALTLTAAAATGASINITDLLDANPTVVVSPDLTGVNIALSFEQAIITGLLPAGVTVQPGTRSVILTEPASDPFGPRQSDFVTLFIGAAAPTFTLNFESDGAATFDQDVAALPPATPTLLENGAVQDLSQLLNTGAFTVTVQSDVGTVEGPEPGSGMLLLSGLLLSCTARFWRKFDKSGR